MGLGRVKTQIRNARGEYPFFLAAGCFSQRKTPATRGSVSYAMKSEANRPDDTSGNVISIKLALLVASALAVSLT